VYICFNIEHLSRPDAEGFVDRDYAVVDGCHLPPGFYVPSTARIGPETDLATLAQVPADASDFSEDVVRTNNELVRGYKAIHNEF
jgi:hypothetical protein